MDHLKTSEERRARWYSTLWPKCVPVTPARDSKDFLPNHHDSVKSIPFDWLQERPTKIHPIIEAALEKNGFAVVSGVLSMLECEDALSLAWDYLEAASVAEQQLHTTGETAAATEAPVRRFDKSTHGSKYFPRAVEGGMLPFYGSGHCTFAWSIRSHQNVKRVFENVYGTTKLVSSLDGIVLWRGGDQHRTDAGWFHMDQNPRHKPNQECIQGLVNMLPVDKTTGGNVLVAQSHKLFPQHYTSDTTHPASEFYNDRLDELGTDDWMEIDPNDEMLLSADNVLMCLLNPGDMVLWDSRVVHCSYPGKTSVPDSPRPTEVSTLVDAAHGLCRAGVLVSMMPIVRVDDKTLQRRREAVDKGRTLTHWANKVAPLGEEQPDQVAMEASRVEEIKKWQKRTEQKVLLEYDDLDSAQKELVVGGD